MFRIAMLSRWHVHSFVNRYVDELADIPNAHIQCVWDEDATRGAQWAGELRVDFEPDLQALLARDDVDGVCVTAATTAHKDLLIACAKAGKHIFTEKSLTTTLQDAFEVQRVVKESGIQFCIAFPRRSNPEFAYARMLYMRGELGRIAIMRVRNGIYGINSLPYYWFDAAQTGGGTLMDLGCHPIYLVLWLLGNPISVSATFSYIHKKAVEDAAVCTILFDNGAIAIIESSYDSPILSTYNFELYGTKGTYLAQSDSEYAILKEADGTTHNILIKSLPVFDPSPMRQWVDACTGEGKILCDIDEAVALIRILDAAYKAHAQRRTVDL